jgi:hypothetical protein
MEAALEETEEKNSRIGPQLFRPRSMENMLAVLWTDFL